MELAGIVTQVAEVLGLHIGRSLRLDGVGTETERERRRKPDEVFAAGQRAEIGGEGVEGLHGYFDAFVHAPGLLVGDEVLEDVSGEASAAADAELGHGVGVGIFAGIVCEAGLFLECGHVVEGGNEGGGVAHRRIASGADLDPTIDCHLAVLDAIGSRRTDAAVSASDALTKFVDHMFDAMERELDPALLDCGLESVVIS